MASSLASTLLGGDPAQLGQIGTMDPSVLAASPQLSLAQTLIQSGMDASPVGHPLQALARIAQTAAGMGMQQGAISDLGKAYSGTAQSLSAAFPPDHPIQKFLQSADPATRAIGIQTAQKALVLGSEAFNPQSGEGKLASDIEHAAVRNPEAATALGRALTKGGMTPEGVVLPPSGVPVPRPAPGMAAGAPGAQAAPVAAPGAPRPPMAPPAIAPGQPGEGGPVAPGNNQRVGEVFGDLPGRIAAAAGQKAAAEAAGKAGVEYGDFVQGRQVQTAGQKAEAEAAGKARAEYGDLVHPDVPLGKTGPGYTAPQGTPHGTTLPPVTAQAPLPKAPKELDQSLTTWNKTKADWASGVQASMNAEQRLHTIAQTFKTMQTGAFVTQKAQVAAALKSAGINIPENLLADPAKAQLALHENYVETLQQLKASTPRFTQMEFKALSQNKEHPDLQPEANLQMLAEDIGALRQSRDLPYDFQMAQRNGWKDPLSFEQAWLRANPLSGYVERTKAEIGPLKGMPGNTGAAAQAAPVQVATPADARRLAPGTRFMTPDGQVREVPRGQ